MADAGLKAEDWAEEIESRLSDRNDRPLECAQKSLESFPDNARLLEETEQRAERERLVADISSRMFAANELETIVQIASEELGRILQVKQTTVKVRTEAAASLQPGDGQTPDQHA